MPEIIQAFPSLAELAIRVALSAGIVLLIASLLLVAGYAAFRWLAR